MGEERRTVVRSDALGVEAYRLTGRERPFPRHFHDYYVIGYMEAGERTLSCGDREYRVGEGTLLLFRPGESHACVQRGGALDYRGLNIPEAAMARWAGEAPRFPSGVVLDPDLARLFRRLHEGIMSGAPGGEEELRCLLRGLRQRGEPPAAPACREEVERACAFMERHRGERVSLDQVCRCAGLSKSALLRAFVEAKGVTPYNYLENIRVGEAQRLLEQGVPPAEAALRTGFSDQSHLTNTFRRFLGLPPGAYGRDVRKQSEPKGELL